MLALCSAASLPCVASPRARSGRTACAARAPLRTAYARCMAPCGLVLAAPGAPHVQLGVATTRRRLVVLAASSTGNQELVKDSDFSITKVSFGSIGLSVGLTLLVAGFLGYFGFVGGRGADNSLSALLLIYGFPISLIGACHCWQCCAGAALTPSSRLCAQVRRTEAARLRKVRPFAPRFRIGRAQWLTAGVAATRTRLHCARRKPRPFCCKCAATSHASATAMSSIWTRRCCVSSASTRHVGDSLAAWTPL